MARLAGPSRRFRYFGASAAACVAGAIALLALPWASGTASAQTTNASLNMTGVHTASAPSGTNSIELQQGDSIVFSAGAAPQRAVLGFYVILNASPFGGSSAVKLSGSKTYTVEFPSSGTYSFSWTAYSTLGKITPRPGEYTSAAIIVDAPPPDPTTDPGGGNPGGGATSTPPDTSVPTPSGTNTVVAPPGSSLPAPGGSGTSGSTVPGNGRTIVFTTNAQGKVVAVSVPTFGAPQDNGHITATGVTGFGGGVVPSDGGGGGNLGALAGSNGGTNQQFVADPKAATPPRALAVLSIVSLGGVAGSYAWLYLGRRATRG